MFDIMVNVLKSPWFFKSYTFIVFIKSWWIIVVLKH